MGRHLQFNSAAIDVRQLRYFVAIVDAHSISKAALHLHVAQPALSQHVQHMEEGLRAPLLNRTVRGVTPTDAGKRLYATAQTILGQISELPSIVRGAAHSTTGEVKVGIAGTVNELVGIPLLESAYSSSPGINVRLVEGMSTHILDWLRRGEVDLGLVYATDIPDDLVGTHVITEDLYLFGPVDGALSAPPGQPVAFSEIASLALITNGPVHAVRQLIDQAAITSNITIKPIFEVDSYNQIKRLVNLGKGYGILPRNAIASDIRCGSVAAWPIVSPSLRRKVYIVHAKGRTVATVTLAISALARDIIKGLTRDGTWLAEIAKAA